MYELGRKWKVLSLLSGTIYIINLISLHQELSHLFVILPRTKKKNEQPCRIYYPWRASDTTVTAFLMPWEGPLPYHFTTKQKAMLLIYFSLYSAVPRGRRSRDWGEGGGGGDSCWVGPWEVTLTALGALNMPLPIPPAALPNGNTDIFEFPLPSILKCWGGKLRLLKFCFYLCPIKMIPTSLHSLPEVS